MSVPIESATINVGKALALATGVILGAFAVGGWVVRVELQQAALQRGLDDNQRLLANICKAVNCDGKGLRE